jgi:hypothetical protein
MTAQEFINSTLRLIGVLASGETPSVSESDDAFVALNQMLGSWSAAQAPVYQITLETVPLTGAETYTLANRPVRIRSAASVAGGASLQRPVQIVDANGWTGVADRTRTGAWVETLFYDGGWPDGKIHVSPKPSDGDLELWCYMPLTEVASLSDNITFPPGYEHAIRFSLAEVLAGEYGMPLPDTVARGAAEAKSGLAQLNAQVLGPPAPPPPPAAAA